MLSRILKYTQAVLGLWLIVEVSVFPDEAALWVAFGTAIAFTAVAALDAVVGFVQGRFLPPILAVGIVLLGGYHVAGSDRRRSDRGLRPDGFEACSNTRVAAMRKSGSRASP